MAQQRDYRGPGEDSGRRPRWRDNDYRPRDGDRDRVSSFRDAREQRAGGEFEDSDRFDAADRRMTHHDEDYARWRDEHLKKLDADYQDWRTERRKKFVEEFDKWRADRAKSGPSAAETPNKK